MSAGDVAGNADLLGDEAVEVSELRGAAGVYTTSAISPLDFPPPLPLLLTRDDRAP